MATLRLPQVLQCVVRLQHRQAADLTQISLRMSRSQYSKICGLQRVTVSQCRAITKNSYNYHENRPVNNVMPIGTSGRKAVLVIFDKDRSVVFINMMWSPWARKIAAKIRQVAGLGVTDKIYYKLGMSGDENVSNGILMERTPSEVSGSIVSVLLSGELRYEKAMIVVNQVWRESADVVNDIKIAVTTGETRDASLDDLIKLGVMRYESVLNFVLEKNKPSKNKPNSPLSNAKGNYRPKLARAYSTLYHDKVCQNHYNIQKRNFSTTLRCYMDKYAATYDYVIVGAGSAGSTLANRLSENPDNKILVLEAGPKDVMKWDSWKIHMPAALMYNLCDDKYNWYYHTEPEKGMNNRVMYWPRGRVFGGSSSLNAMVYVRGHALDYDRWQKEGAEAWSYADCLPYFRKAQTHELGPDEYRGGDGPLHVSRGISHNPLLKAFIDAGVEAGYPYTDDMNGYQQEGLGWMDMTIHKGKRWNAASAYLRPALKRPNLTAEVKALTTRILFEKNRAIGVEYTQNGQTKQVRAEKELILSGGTINSSQLLMLSGIGNADDLRKLDIPVVQHLPGVGENLQDHLDVSIQYECTQPITLYSAQWKFPHNMIRIGLEWFLRKTGDGATTHLESGGFIRSRPDVEHPDIQFHFFPTAVYDHGRVICDRHSYQAHVGPMRPTSRGYVKLKSRDPTQHPRIVANYLTTEQDIMEMRDCVKLTREIFAQKSFDPFRGPEIQPGPDVKTDAEIDAFSRKVGDTTYHPSCTCKMGSPDDPMTVVDPSTKVLGIDGLRVVDASIMPSIVSGNLNGPTIMMAEKAADIILGKPPLPKSSVPVYRPKTLETQR